MFPARAGMNRFSFLKDTWCLYVPRTSGDEPANGYQLPKHPRCSPHERG